MIGDHCEELRRTLQSPTWSWHANCSKLEADIGTPVVLSRLYGTHIGLVLVAWSQYYAEPTIWPSDFAFLASCGSRWTDSGWDKVSVHEGWTASSDKCTLWSIADMKHISVESCHLANDHTYRSWPTTTGNSADTMWMSCGDEITGEINK